MSVRVWLAQPSHVAIDVSGPELVMFGVTTDASQHHRLSLRHTLLECLHCISEYVSINVLYRLWNRLWNSHIVQPIAAEYIIVIEEWTLASLPYRAADYAELCCTPTCHVVTA